MQIVFCPNLVRKLANDPAGAGCSQGVLVVDARVRRPDDYLAWAERIERDFDELSPDGAGVVLLVDAIGVE